MRTEPSPAPSPPRRPDAGYTLVELLAVMLLALVPLAFHLRGPPPDPFRLVDHAARGIQAEVLRALAEADARGGEAVLYADVRAGGRYLALSGDPGVDTVPGVPSSWVALERGVQWSAGGAEEDPAGEPLGRVRVPAGVRCEGYRCGLGVEDRVVYYLSHALDPGAAAAVTLSREGLVRRYRFEPATGRWRDVEP